MVRQISSNPIQILENGIYNLILGGFTSLYTDAYIFIFEYIGKSTLVPIKFYNGGKNPKLGKGTGSNPPKDISFNFKIRNKNSKIIVSYLLKKNENEMKE